ncbi:uncharacterized protein PHALS_02624 [Plasmopara halstedii]|uniref:Uncharacterized protein n=1 Tax=Plasmopara halstedii TaxID=4781 RepID=A0A0P1AV64_PLAHL|nr:uncharacterized protein PHALS_02624 [Plasmopara halstedii]CEG46209.1 hypothetical protein PHALS_02624 [Plasmopara halstedii]|eukprot:XP_024582578.1 hypothetical protein PHALS_02624 [Plasmopara halstedii]
MIPCLEEALTCRIRVIQALNLVSFFRKQLIEANQNIRFSHIRFIDLSRVLPCEFRLDVAFVFFELGIVRSTSAKSHY